jgi:hypothetical protein
MTDGRGLDVALVLVSPRGEAKTGTSEAKAACIRGDRVVAEATTYKDSRTLSPTQELPLLRLIIPAQQLRSTESHSLYECERAR